MKLILGDSLQKLKDLPTATVDAIVTDPPYGWRFMGKAWDGADIEKYAKNGKGAERRLSSDGVMRKGREKPAEAAGTYDVSKEGNQYFMFWTSDWATEALRVLKPGGHMLVFCGPRTYHAMAMGVEMAGFEIRDQLQWLFGSGFPKSLDVSKAIDKAEGAKREVIEERFKRGDMRGGNFMAEHAGKQTRADITAPATDDAKRWQGFGTALKPANEPIVLARKPLEKGLTVAQNVLAFGTGAINVDASRIAAEGMTKRHNGADRSLAVGAYGVNKKEFVCEPHAQGRWPANVIFSEDAALVLDESVGDNVSRFFKVCGHESIKVEDTFVGKKTANKSECLSIAGSGNKLTDQYHLTTISITKTKTHSTMSFQISNAFTKMCIGLCTIVSEKIIDSLTESSIESVSVVSNTEASINLLSGEQVHIRGTVSLALVNDLPTGERKIENITTLTCGNTESGPLRFQYQAKSSKRERNAGLEGMPKKFTATMNDGIGAREHNPDQPSAHNQNFHPTVKPIKLMEYLVRMITPPGGIVLDPFMGSGTTGCAAAKLGFQFIGIEREAEYLEIARKRIEYWASHAPDEADSDPDQLSFPEAGA